MNQPNSTGVLDGLPPLSELLPLGYVYLLTLGIASQSIYFGFLGINFLEYSDLLDVLISPLSLVTGNLAMLLVVIGVVILLFPYLWLVRKLALRKNPRALDRGLMAQPLAQTWLQLCAGALFCAFVGLGLGSGSAMSERMGRGELSADHQITYLDGTSEEVRLLGKNTGYLFFARTGETVLTVAPVADNVHTIQALPEKVPEASTPAEASGEAPDSEESEQADVDG